MSYYIISHSEKQILRKLRYSADAMKVAEEKKDNATNASAAATEKAEEAERQKDAAEKMLKELEQGKDQLEKMRVAAAKAAENDKQEQAAWRAAEKDLEQKVKAVADEEEEIQKIQAEMRKLADRLMDHKTAKAEKEIDKNEQEVKVQKAAADATAAGGIKRAAMEAQQKAAAAYEDAEKHCREQETRAEAAEKDSKEAQADADFARHLQDEAETDLQNKLATKELVVELRESVQAYYDEVDAMTKSMEARIAENEASGSPKKAHELMTEDEHVKQSMIIYNKMVLVFNRLFHEEKQFFEMVNESNKEISENAQAAILLQCDPTEDLEIAARESGNLADLDEKCGTGLWDKLDLERQQFATDKDEVDTAAAPPTPVKLQTDSSEVSEEASNEATSLRQDDLQNPAMLQVRDLDVARQIRRHGFPM